MTTEDELLQFGLAWDQAMVGNDADEISKFMSDDWNPRWYGRWHHFQIQISFIYQVWRTNT